MLRDFTWAENYEEAMSDEHPLNVYCGIDTISMPIASNIYNAANYVIAKNNCQSYFKKFEVLFSRK